MASYKICERKQGSRSFHWDVSVSEHAAKNQPHRLGCDHTAVYDALNALIRPSRVQSCTHHAPGVSFSEPPEASKVPHRRLSIAAAALRGAEKILQERSLASEPFLFAHVHEGRGVRRLQQFLLGQDMGQVPEMASLSASDTQLMVGRWFRHANRHRVSRIRASHTFCRQNPGRHRQSGTGVQCHT